ncbi:hypothetical protein [Luteibacter yeojuensis]
MFNFSRSLKIYLGFLLFMVCGIVVAASNQEQSAQVKASRYIYCNVYAGTVCFGISGGDELTMSLPIDFTIYDLTLPHSVKVRVYLGYNPKMDIFESAKPCGSEVEATQCRYVTSTSKWDILYAGKGTQPFVHIHIEGEGNDAKQVVHDFLGNFRPCSREGASIKCTDKRIFAAID